MIFAYLRGGKLFSEHTKPGVVMKKLLVVLCAPFVFFGFAIQAYALSIVWDQSPATVSGIREPTSELLTRSQDKSYNSL